MRTQESLLVIVSVVLAAACSSATVSGGSICGRYAQEDLRRVDANGLPIWANEVFDNCGVGSADWSTAGGKEAGFQLAWQTAVLRIVQGQAPQNVTVFEVITTNSWLVGEYSSTRGHFQSVMKAETPKTGVRVRTVAKAYHGYNVYVLVEKVE
jgi:hypothetical protein